jgi:hypothetical protein
MRPYLYKNLLLCLLSCICYTALGQNSKLDSTKADTIIVVDKPTFKIGIDYLNNYVFMGRGDTSSTPIITPHFKYTFKSGIYISGSVDFVTNRKKNKLDGGDLALGYTFDLTDDLSGDVSFTKLFYSAASTQVSSAINSTINGSLDYNLGEIVTASMSVDYDLNKQDIYNDVILNLEISHDFEVKGILGDKDRLLISPAIATNIGTQNFYEGYIIRRNLKGEKLKTAQNTLINAYYARLSQFKVLDYEFSMPVEYKIGKMIFHFTPTYAIAQNQFKSPAIINALNLTDQSGVFYFEIGAAVKF